MILAATAALGGCAWLTGESDPFARIEGELALTPVPPPLVAAAPVAEEESPLRYFGPGGGGPSAYFRLSGADRGYAAQWRVPGPDGRLAIISATLDGRLARDATPSGLWARTTAFKTMETWLGVMRYAPFETDDTRCLWFERIALGEEFEPQPLDPESDPALWGAYCVGGAAPSPSVFATAIIRGVSLREPRAALMEEVDEGAPVEPANDDSPTGEPLGTEESATDDDIGVEADGEAPAPPIAEDEDPTQSDTPETEVATPADADMTSSPDDPRETEEEPTPTEEPGIAQDTDRSEAGDDASAENEEPPAEAAPAQEI